jgi:hypothetical protein
MRTVNKVALGVLFLVGAIVSALLFKSPWLAAAVLVVPLVILTVAIQFFITYRWTHPFLRRTDQQLVTVLGPEAVHAALTWHDEHYQGGKFATFPLPRTRLAWFAEGQFHR